MAGSGGSMMQSPVLEGIAENTVGIKIGGFHSRVMEMAGRLEDFKKRFGYMDLVAQHELEGHVLFIAVQNFRSPEKYAREVAYFRQEPHKFFEQLPRFLSSLEAHSIHDISVSGSMGVLSLVVSYRRA